MCRQCWWREPGFADGQAEQSNGRANTRGAYSPPGGLPPKQPGCRRQFLVRGANGLRYRLCGRATCCRECRAQWAWKEHEILRRACAATPPTHFVTLHAGAGMGDGDFVAAVGAFLKALRRTRADVEYARVWEWSRGRRHAHLLLRAGRDPRPAMNAARDKTGVWFGMNEVGCVPATLRYFVKHLRDPGRKAALPPPGHGGKLLVASRGFYGRPRRELWAALRVACGKNAPGRNTRGSADEDGTGPQSRQEKTGTDAAAVHPRGAGGRAAHARRQVRGVGPGRRTATRQPGSPAARKPPCGDGPAASGRRPRRRARHCTAVSWRTCSSGPRGSA